MRERQNKHDKYENNERRKRDRGGRRIKERESVKNELAEWRNQVKRGKGRMNEEKSKE